MGLPAVPETHPAGASLLAWRSTGSLRCEREKRLVSKALAQAWAVIRALSAQIDRGHGTRHHIRTRKTLNREVGVFGEGCSNCHRGNLEWDHGNNCQPGSSEPHHVTPTQADRSQRLLIQPRGLRRNPIRSEMFITESINF